MNESKQKRWNLQTKHIHWLHKTTKDFVRQLLPKQYTEWILQMHNTFNIVFTSPREFLSNIVTSGGDSQCVGNNYQCVGCNYVASAHQSQDCKGSIESNCLFFTLVFSPPFCWSVEVLAIMSLNANKYEKCEIIMIPVTLELTYLCLL